MNKTQLLIVAATALASTLPALGADFQVGSNTTIDLSGLIAVGVKNSEVTNLAPGDTRPVQSEWRINDNTSRFIFSGATVLNSDWKIIFRVESRFVVNACPYMELAPGLYQNGKIPVSTGDATGWADGDSWAGVATPIGSFVFGKSTLYYLDGLCMDYFGVNGPGESYRAWDGNGLGVFNLLSNVGSNIIPIPTMDITRSSNVVRYDSVKAAGFDLTLAYTKNPGGQENTVGETAFGRPYENGGTTWARVRSNHGPFTACASCLNRVVQGGVNSGLTADILNAVLPAGFVKGPMDTHATRYGVGYSLPMGLKFGAVYDTTAVDNGILGTTLTAKRSVLEVPVRYSWGPHAVYVTYNKAGSTTNIANSGATQMTYGYDVALSKRVFVGAFFTTLSNQANGNYQPFLANTVLGGTGPGVGENWHQFSVDLNYWF